jgi:DNA (cytosine-5)-methyltransferase 1
MTKATFSRNGKGAPRVLDLFSGAGGTAWGFRQAGFEIIGAIDNDPQAVKTYERNLGVKPSESDLDTLEAEELLSLFNLRPYELEVLVGCPPCQGFTNMRGDKGADDPRNSLVMRYLEFVDVLRPRCIVFENVPGINKRHGQEKFESLCLGLADLNYGFDRKNPDRILNAADYGVPQLRERVVLIAGRDNVCVPYPEPTHGKPGTSSVEAGQLKPWKTVQEAFFDLPHLEAGQSSDIPNHRTRNMGPRVKKFIQMIQEPGGSRTDVPPEYWLPCHQKEGCGHLDVYGRLPLEAPSGVMTSGCTNVSKGRFAHPTQDRGISFREAARLQSFPDDFVFEGNNDDISRQIGNAVPPLLAEAIAKSIYQWLDTQNE